MLGRCATVVISACHTFCQVLILEILVWREPLKQLRRFSLEYPRPVFRCGNAAHDASGNTPHSPWLGSTGGLLLGGTLYFDGPPSI